MKNAPKRLAIILALCGTSVPATAPAKSPDKLSLNPSSKTALVIIKADWWRPALNMRSAFKLALSAYDPAEKKLLGGPFAGGAVFEAQDKNFAEGHLIAEIKPGRWTFQSYSQQDLWALCFNAASYQFEVKGGEVVYLGQLDALRHRQELGEQVVRTGKIAINGYGFADFFDLPDGPHLASIDDEQLDAVRDMLGRRARLVTAPVRAAEYSPASFGTGSTLLAQRRCGGYFTTGAKDGKKAKS
jgi:hypothetical protein